MSSSNGIKVLATTPINNDPITKKLVDDFRDYKNGIRPNYPLFGRDTPFTENKQLELSQIFKVHIIENGDDYDMNRSQNENKSDSCHLVYCEHYQKPELLCVIAILIPNAHKQARDNNIIDSLVRISEKFHSINPEKYFQKSA